MSTEGERQGLQWQVGVWDRIAQLYRQEVDPRFASVVDSVLRRADLKPGERVLDLGTGTGSVAMRAAALVGPAGSVIGVDISPDMLALARRRLVEAGHSNVELREGRAEQLPADSGAFDALLASFSLMYVIDRAAAAREMRRVLRPGGRFVAAVWAAPSGAISSCSSKRPGGLPHLRRSRAWAPERWRVPSDFLVQLADAGIVARLEVEELGFDFPDFELAWEVLAGVTTARLAERRPEAKEAVQAAMWPRGDGPRHFRNVTQFLVGRAAG